MLAKIGLCKYLSTHIEGASIIPEQVVRTLFLAFLSSLTLLLLSSSKIRTAVVLSAE